MDRFEVALLGTLGTRGHPNIIHLIGYVDRPKGLVLRRYACSLRDVIRDTTAFPVLSVGQALSWAQDIATGMMEVHRFGIVHLDL